MTDSDWQTLAVNVFYRKKNGYVTILNISVSIKGTSESATLIGTLPDGYHPQYMILQGHFNGSGSWLQIEPNGEVYAFGTTECRCTVTYPV